MVKVITVPGKDKILGAAIVGDNAGELITEFISAMRHGYGLNRILATIHIYPTIRITSYNVCYTKLLRFSISARRRRGIEPDT